MTIEHQLAWILENVAIFCMCRVAVACAIAKINNLTLHDTAIIRKNKQTIKLPPLVFTKEFGHSVSLCLFNPPFSPCKQGRWYTILLGKQLMLFCYANHLLIKILVDWN
jgi:hypothetical protein